MARLGDVVAAMQRLYPESWAESWDAVGLVCGDPDDDVRRILLAVDPTPATVAEAIDGGAQLLITHHPLFLRGVHGVPASTPKGRLVHRLIRAGVGLYAAHTNADCADPGVSDALALALGLVDLRPLRPRDADPLDTLITYVPTADAERLVDALSAAGAGAIGNYTRCAFTSDGRGTFEPRSGATPAVGRVDERAHVAETRIEMVLPRAGRGEIVAALRATHPYEEPAFSLLETAALPGSRGTGRIGHLPRPMTLREFVDDVAERLPRAPVGVRAAGDPDDVLATVAVCGGAGDSLLGDATAAGVDCYLTGDLRHHPATEHALAGGPALIDVGHWASEWPWLSHAARALTAATGVETVVSDIVTDPWTLAIGRSR